MPLKEPKTKLTGKPQTLKKKIRNIPYLPSVVSWCHLTKTPQSVTLRNLEAK